MRRRMRSLPLSSRKYLFRVSSFADQPVAIDMTAGDIPDPEVKQLDRGVVAGEMAAVLDYLPQLEVN